MRGQELFTVIVYDITSDRIRLKIADVCKDYGLDHVQYSVFSGPLDSTRRNEMFARLGDTLGNNEGKVMMLQMCEKDASARARNRPNRASGRMLDTTSPHRTFAALTATDLKQWAYCPRIPTTST